MWSSDHVRIILPVRPSWHVQFLSIHEICTYMTNVKLNVSINDGIGGSNHYDHSLNCNLTIFFLNSAIETQSQ